MRSRLTTSLAAAVMALTLVTAVPASAHGPGHHHRPATYLLDPVGPAADDVYPEGVAAHGGHFYVSSTTDGTIYRGDLDEPTATPFLPGGQDGRVIAVGLKVDGRTLLVAGGFHGSRVGVRPADPRVDRVVAGGAGRHADVRQRPGREPAR
ncbi:MAG: hypothetical protein NVV70_12125 [Cellulomonas sp.]|nr:hypothetical protein [Cellulomonas sp.]MCR6648835.1 hypothetical protein [Cellulomonas sp.]